MDSLIRTVTVGIPAHNEERNISRLMDSILAQNEGGYALMNVIVACDGCTDGTAGIVRSYSAKNHLVKLIDDGHRLGQASRLNNFFRDNDSDIFVTFDGDVVLAHVNVLTQLVRAFDSNEVGLVGGSDVAADAHGFFGKIAVAWSRVWYWTKIDINHGITIHNHHGCVSAYSRDLCKKISIPAGVYANDDSAFFEAFKHGFKFNFAREAEVMFKCPDNLPEYLQQSSRLLQGKDIIAIHYGKWVYPYYEVPIINKAKGMLKSFIVNPIYTSLAVGLQVYLRLNKSKYFKRSADGHWAAIKSTKS